ncbi:hypothetical protein KSP40_PGU007517 [Platanthera guangdongensis]|uniref:Glycosyl hydrolase family 13 catalytic domain-containing protein n=1 Tax=Platanthera guangdongensis TaxID=2320717 RepID=A0ABR2MAT6_9ASPA
MACSCRWCVITVTSADCSLQDDQLSSRLCGVYFRWWIATRKLSSEKGICRMVSISLTPLPKRCYPLLALLISIDHADPATASTAHPLANYVSFHRLSPELRQSALSLSSISTPNSVQEALQHPGWREAIDEEMSPLWANHTWDLVSLPPGQSCVGCKWVFAVKQGPDGTVHRLKARIVARCFTQQQGLDYDETFSPVAKLNTIRETIYMQQPPGFETTRESLVCCLKRSLYGLKQSPWAWNTDDQTTSSNCVSDKGLGKPSIFSWSRNLIYHLLLELSVDSCMSHVFLIFSSLDDRRSTMLENTRKNDCRVNIGNTSSRDLSIYLSFSSKENSHVFSLYSDIAKGEAPCRYLDSLTKDMENKLSRELAYNPYNTRTRGTDHAGLAVGGVACYIYKARPGLRPGLGALQGPISAGCPTRCPWEHMIGLDFDCSCIPFYLSFLLQPRPNFQWGIDKHPHIPMEKLVVYRLNIDQFTKSKSSGLPENVAGTFTGLIKKLPHLINLGVNALLLEPIFSFDVERGSYFPYHFFSPASIYGDKDEKISCVYSMKEMVKVLHAQGIEVLLEVSFSHTCEGGDAYSQAISFGGIDNSSYYFIDGNVDSKTCSALKCSDPIVQKMILDCLHYWVTEFHVDGFCFTNSSSLLRGSNGDQLSRPPLVESIALDPILSNTKIISDCWSPVDMSYKDVTFPHWQRWAEMNSKYFHDIRNFLRGKGLLRDLATRLCGSGDVFTALRGPMHSFNFITKNAGLTLVDLVSFSDGDLASELSWNCGVEGPTDKISVLKIRLRQVRNFLFILFISLGVPVMNMGDEFGYSTGGSASYTNRNPIDWSSLRTEFSIQTTNFIVFLTTFRNRRNDLFQRKNFLKVENIIWHGSGQLPPKWEDPSCKFLSLELKAEKDAGSPNSYNGDLFISFNASDLPELATLPELSEEYVWFLLVDTSLPYPYFFSSDSDSQNNEGLSSYELKPHTCAMFEAKVLNL